MSIGSLGRPTRITDRPAAGLTSRGDRAFRPDIQGLRAVAVVLVVLYHCGVPGIRGGYVGVDVFFVISGFLITRQLLTEHGRSGRISLSRFYARRIRRLLPSALTVVLVTELLARFLGPPLQSSTVAEDGIFSTFYLMNYRLAAQGIDYQNAAGPVSPLQHFWSLAVEEQFYIFWPLAIVVAGLVFRRRTTAALGGLAVAAVVASFVVSILLTRHNATLAYFAIQTRAWELGVGAMIAIGTPLLLRLGRPIVVIAGWCGLAMIVASAVVFTAATPFPGMAAAAPVAGAGLVVASGLGSHRTGGWSGTSVEQLLRARLMQFLGRVSYGWYLWHWPLIVLVPSIVGATFGWGLNVAVSIVSLGLAWTTNVLIEQSTARKPLSRRQWFTWGAAMSVVVSLTAVTIVVLPPSHLESSGPAPALDLAGTGAATLPALLDAAYARPTVPSNLSPALDKAVDDVPPTTANGCHAPFLATTEAPCVFGDPHGSRTVVLFGDSHAEQWFGALDALATSKGWRLVSWTKAACPLADVLFMNAQLQRPYTECPQWRTNTIRQISALHPDLVIAGGSDALPGPDYSNVTWAAETAKDLSLLRASADQVVYLADIPRPTTNVPVCLASNLSAPGRCQFSAASQADGAWDNQQVPDRHVAVAEAARRAGASVIDPTSWFCTATGCPAVVSDTLVYRDATHVTQSYSRALEPVMGQALAAVVPWMTRS